MDENAACPVCTMPDLLESGAGYECATCGHEWTPAEDLAPAERQVTDANGNLLQDGDSVALTKDLKVKGSSATIKVGTKVKGIRIIDGDHEIDCKLNGQGILLKAEFVRKV